MPLILSLFCYKLQQIIKSCTNTHDYRDNDMMNKNVYRWLNIITKQFILTLSQIIMTQLIFGYSIWEESIPIEDAKLKSIAASFAYPWRDFVILYVGFTLYLGFSSQERLYLKSCSCCHIACLKCYSKCIKSEHVVSMHGYSLMDENDE